MFIIIPNYTSTKIIPLVIFDTKITQIRIKFLTRHKLTHFTKQMMKLECRSWLHDTSATLTWFEVDGP